MGSLVVASALAGCRDVRPPPETGAPPRTEPERAAVDRKAHPATASADPLAVAEGRKGAVASASVDASKVGLSVLQQGGNAVDAAVAMGFALAVTHPSAGNIGGGGFMVVRMADGTATTFDFREAAPAAAHRDMYLGPDGAPTEDSRVGAKAAGIPGTVAGLALAHERFGSRPWRSLVEPAVTLARDGHVLDAFHADDLRRGAEAMKKAGFERSAAFYLRPDGSFYEPGDVWKQPVLAATLARIADEPRSFYEGPVAEALVAGVRRAGGVWSLEDLRSYRAKERAPIRFDYRGVSVVTMPPPSAGGVVLRQLFAASEALRMYDMPWRSVAEVHHHIEACRRVYADRNMLLGDPDFVRLPLERLLDPAYVARRMKDVRPDRATPSSEVGAGAPPPPESEETTHYSVVDAAGNAVAVTTTLNLGFGSKFVVPEVGVLLNDEMDDFSVKPGSPNAFGLVQGEPNAIAPGKRMLSSMTPTILVAGGRLRAVLGTPGGPTITTTVFQIARALVDYGLSLDAAVEAVRVHHQWLPDVAFAEARIPEALERGLAALGHEIRKRPAMGHANVIEVLDDGTRRAVADRSRDGGAALAY
ncbi:MAG: gamma-glutamyltransferase [Deltaproteobacteria bacterium]|nr:MAG: gamma-glutamyltransferase [Deltaproteobacteria bacterium]